ncbi:MAG: hypothetical protein K8R57_02975 [Verrucomicrobia bacterium]|nr:hypothetical protein [Verrucomicrobiota bacterium]
MTTKAPALPKNIAALVKRESELQAQVDKWSQAAFREERDRLTAVVHSGSATDEEIALHADFRDGGKINGDFSAMEASCSAALDAFRRANWEEFRQHLINRLALRVQREADYVLELAQVATKYGIEIQHSDDQSSTTRQLEDLCSREDGGFISFLSATETF